MTLQQIKEVATSVFEIDKITVNTNDIFGFRGVLNESVTMDSENICINRESGENSLRLYLDVTSMDKLQLASILYEFYHTSVEIFDNQIKGV